MTRLFPSASELAEHAHSEPGDADWQPGEAPLQHSPQTCAVVVALGPAAGASRLAA